jgi:hypothetical protein
MRQIRISVIAIAVVSIFAATVTAKEEWKTVTLRGEVGLTISIPSAGTNEIGKRDPDDLMLIAVSTRDYGDLTCIATRSNYPKGITQAALAAGIATERRKAFCDPHNTKISGLSIYDSASFMHNGLQAAVCTASYTDSAEKSPGRVGSQMIIAAPIKNYQLTCTVEDETQEKAEEDWVIVWADKVKHMQDSFHLPN